MTAGDELCGTRSDLVTNGVEAPHMAAILVVDDSRGVTWVLERILSVWGTRWQAHGMELKRCDS